MNASQITQFGKNMFIELPNTDALQYMSNQKCLDRFLLNYGDVTVELVNNVYTVPSYAEGRKEYTRIKSQDCKIWGCE